MLPACESASPTNDPVGQLPQLILDGPDFPIDDWLKNKLGVHTKRKTNQERSQLILHLQQCASA